MYSLASSLNCWMIISSEIYVFTSTPVNSYKQANLGNPNLIEFKIKIKTLASNQAIILEAFILKTGYLTGLWRFVIIISRKLSIWICVCWCWWPVDLNATFMKPSLGC